MNPTLTSLSTPRPDRGMGAWFHGVLRALWQTLEDSGRARAERHLLDYARQCESHQPDLAKELRAASARTRQA